MPTLFGLSAALATPFDHHGHVDQDRLVDQARHCLASGCRSVTLFGTTGEGASVGREEQRAALHALLAGGIRPQQIVLGVLLNAAPDAVEHIALAQQLKLKNVLLAPPSYYKGISDDGVYAWFAEVFDALGEQARNILLYHIPSVTAVPLSHAVIARLRAAYPHAVAGVKDSGGEWSYSQALLEAHGDLMILIGNEQDLARAVRMGAQGAISGMANFAATIISRLAEDGQDDPRVGRILDAFDHMPVTPAVKVLTAAHRGDTSWLNVRAPLQPLSKDDVLQLSSVYDQLLGTQGSRLQQEAEDGGKY